MPDGGMQENSEAIIDEQLSDLIADFQRDENLRHTTTGAYSNRFRASQMRLTRPSDWIEPPSCEPDDEEPQHEEGPRRTANKSLVKS